MDEGVTNSDMEALFEHYVALERQNPLHPSVIDMVRKRNHGAWDMTTLPILVNNRMRVSYLLLAWLGAQSSEIPAYVTTVLGCYAAVFYKDHPADALLSLEWVGTQGGKGKVISFRQIFPWAAAAATEDGKNIFDIVKFAEEQNDPEN